MCNNNEEKLLGYPADISNPGAYYLKTNPDPPFAQEGWNKKGILPVFLAFLPSKQAIFSTLIFDSKTWNGKKHAISIISKGKTGKCKCQMNGTSIVQGGAKKEMKGVHMCVFWWKTFRTFNYEWREKSQHKWNFLKKETIGFLYLLKVIV